MSLSGWEGLTRALGLGAMGLSLGFTVCAQWDFLWVSMGIFPSYLASVTCFGPAALKSFFFVVSLFVQGASPV